MIEYFVEVFFMEPYLPFAGNNSTVAYKVSENSQKSGPFDKKIAQQIAIQFAGNGNVGRVRITMRENDACF